MARKTKIARTLHFETLADLLAEAHQIAAEPNAQSNGQWTPAQNIWHVGRVILASVEGFPAKVPFIFRLVGPLLLGRYTRRSFNPGLQVPTKLAAHFIAEPDTTIAQAIEMLEAAVQKRQAKGYIPASPLFGKMTAGQWDQLHCRHAQMHLGMIQRSA